MNLDSFKVWLQWLFLIFASVGTLAGLILVIFEPEAPEIIKCGGNEAVCEPERQNRVTKKTNTQERSQAMPKPKSRKRKTAFA
jgi:hypothetical protein